MKNLLKDYEFINNMDEDLDEIIYNFIIEADQKLYEKMIKKHPNYSDWRDKRIELNEIIFKDKLKEYNEYEALVLEIEASLNKASFLFGFKLGMKLHS